MIFRGLSTSGDAKLGGMDFDRALMGYVLKKEGLNLDALSDRDKLRASARLIQGVDVLKRDLAVLEKSLLAVSDVLPGRHIDPFYFSIDKLYYSIVQNIRILFYGVV